MSRTPYIIFLILAQAVMMTACKGNDETKHLSASDFSTAIGQAKGYTYPTDTLNPGTARQMGLALLEHDSVKANVQNRMEVLRLLTDAARMALDYEEQVKYATQLATLCRDNDMPTEALRTESEIGIVLTHLGQREEGFAMLDKAIAQLESQRHFSELDAYVIAMKRKLTALSLLPSITMPGDSVTAQQRTADIIALAGRYIAKLDDYEQHPDDYADNSPRQPDTDDVPGYCDFYRTQAYAFLAQAYATSGNREKAREYIQKFELSDFGQTLNGRSAITETQRLLGDYDKMLATYDEIDSMAGGDTLNTDYVRQLRGRAIAAEARGDHAASQAYWQRHSLLSEAVNNQLQASEAHGYAARYQEQALKMTLQEKQAAYMKAVLLSIVIGLVLCFSMAFLLYFLRQRHILTEKNRSLARQIEQILKYKSSATPPGTSSPTPSAPVSADEVEEEAPGEAGGHESTSALFRQLSQTIIDEQLFLNPDFDRQAAMTRFHMSKERIGTAFAKGSDYASLAAFVTACRVEHGARLLAEQPELSVAQVATASGFSSVNHFGRSFKSTYGISPSEFRKQRGQA